MMELSAGYLVWAPQGGSRMVPFLASDQDQRTLVHVWAQLSADVQTRVIGLLGQLALNLVVARPEHPSGPLRQQSGGRGALPRPAPHVRLQPRPAYLGHRSSDLSP